ncbi:MAG: hypothetical protein E7Z76_05345 [Methanobrevibacter sp.]|jgi:hypothetical protein|nr:hypothetical protein [Methanobrevibacter sp.]
MKEMRIMCDDRSSNIKDLVRFSTKATLTVPTILLDEATDDFEVYNDFKIAMFCLKNDDGLILTEKEIDDEMSEITIELKGD